MTTDHQDSDERVLAPEIVHNSPMIPKSQKGKMFSKNKVFLDFQKNLNCQLDIKQGQYTTNHERRLRLHEGNHSIDVNPIMTVDSSVKSVIFRDTPNQSNTVPSSFVDQEYMTKVSRYLHYLTV